jgi:hypothetical protein
MGREFCPWRTAGADDRFLRKEYKYVSGKMHIRYQVLRINAPMLKNNISKLHIEYQKGKAIQYFSGFQNENQNH